MRTKRQIVASFEPVLRSNAIRTADRTLRAVAEKDVSLTFLGESGTGKEVLARRAHDLSPRRNGPFVPVNCAAIPEALLESELFGHEKGAFTGATARTFGTIAAAEGGTLFLDEIGEIPLTSQAKLLRFVENRRYTRVGSTTKVQANVRLMFATLRPLDQDVRAGSFRADLFYRIQGLTLEVPPLRERRADILPLLGLFVSQLCAVHDVVPPRLARSAKALLLDYGWPGNVRELRSLVERLCLLRAGKQVRALDLPPPFHARQEDAQRAEGQRPLAFDLNQSLAKITEQILEAVLEQEEGDTVRAANRLQISTRTLQRYVASGRVRSAARSRSTVVQ